MRFMNWRGGATPGGPQSASLNVFLSIIFFVYGLGSARFLRYAVFY